MKGKLIRLASSNNNLRTNEVVGTFDSLPAEGKEFKMFAESLTPGGLFRLVATSPVSKILSAKDNNYLFNSHFSTYELEIITEES